MKRQRLKRKNQELKGKRKKTDIFIELNFHFRNKFICRLRPRKNKADTDNTATTTKGTKENTKKVKVEKDEQETAAETISKTPDYKEGRRSLPAYHPFREDKVRL